MNIVIKLISSVMIIASCAGIGIKHALKLKCRFRCLLDIKNAFVILESEISFASNKLAKAVQNASTGMGNEVCSFLTELSESISRMGAKHAWEQCLSQNRQNLCLTNSDMQILLPLGSELGTTDTSNQIRTLRHITALTDVQCTQARLDYERNAKMYAGISLLLGLAVVIVLF